MNRLNLQFRHQPTEESRIAPLIHYYNEAKGDLVIPKRDLVLNALEAFWLPFGVRWCQGTPEEIEDAVSRSIYLLEHQIEFLRDRFSQSSTKPRQVAQAPKSKTTNLRIQLYSSTEEEVRDSDDEMLLEEGHDYTDEDSLLDSIF